MNEIENDLTPSTDPQPGEWKDPNLPVPAEGPRVLAFPTFPRGREDSLCAQCWRVVMNSLVGDEPIQVFVTAADAIMAIQRASKINGRVLNEITNVGASLQGLVYL